MQKLLCCQWSKPDPEPAFWCCLASRLSNRAKIHVATYSCFVTLWPHDDVINKDQTVSVSKFGETLWKEFITVHILLQTFSVLLCWTDLMLCVSRVTSPLPFWPVSFGLCQSRSAGRLQKQLLTHRADFFFPAGSHVLFELRSSATVYGVYYPTWAEYLKADWRLQ